MKYSIVLASSGVWGPEMLDIARGAEELGYDRLWTTERAGRDGLLRVAEVALSTKTIGVATGITFAFTRNPVAMAGAATELDRITNHRFTLGLGTGTRGVRRWFGEEFDHPAPRLAEYVDLVRQVLTPASQGHKFDGRFYSANLPSFEGIGGRGEARAPLNVPIYAGGLNRIMLTAMAKACDGVALHPLAVGDAYMESVVAPAIGKGTQRRTLPEPPKVAAWLLVSVDDDVEHAFAAARQQLAFYFCTPSYGTVAEVCGWGDQAKALQEEFKRIGGDWETLGKLVPDEMVAAFCPSGTKEHVAAELSRFADNLGSHGVDEIVLEPAVIGLSADEIIRTFQNTLLLRALV